MSILDNFSKDCICKSCVNNGKCNLQSLGCKKCIFKNCNDEEGIKIVCSYYNKDKQINYNCTKKYAKI